MMMWSRCIAAFLFVVAANCAGADAAKSAYDDMSAEDICKAIKDKDLLKDQDDITKTLWEGMQKTIAARQWADLKDEFDLVEPTKDAKGEFLTALKALRKKIDNLPNAPKAGEAKKEDAKDEQK
jgi:hypothetical protein